MSKNSISIADLLGVVAVDYAVTTETRKGLRRVAVIEIDDAVIEEMKAAARELSIPEGKLSVLDQAPRERVSIFIDTETGESTVSTNPGIVEYAEELISQVDQAVSLFGLTSIF